MIEIICQELRKKRLVIFTGEQKIVNVHFFKKTTNINSYRYYYIYIKTIQCYTHVKSETIVENCNVYSSEVDQQTDHKNHKNRAAKRACTRARAHHSSIEEEDTRNIILKAEILLEATSFCDFSSGSDRSLREASSALCSREKHRAREGERWTEREVVGARGTAPCDGQRCRRERGGQRSECVQRKVQRVGKRRDDCGRPREEREEPIAGFGGDRVAMAAAPAG